MNDYEMYLGYDFETDIDIPVTEHTERRLLGVTFPDTYMISKDYITPVKKQYAGNCWTFAAMAMFESYLLKEGKTHKGQSNSIFSETHVTYSIFDIRDSSGKTENPEGLVAIEVNGKQKVGGNRTYVQSYIAKRNGVVLEDVDCNYLSVNNKKFKHRKNDITQKKKRQYDVAEYRFLENPVIPNDPTFINNIKYALQNYGIVTIGIEYASKYRQKLVDTTYGTTLTYYKNSNDKSPSGHALAIVGWDDNFPKDHFLIKPKRNGAFKMKNSWGEGGDYGDGYVWVSYENVGFRGAAYLTELYERDNIPCQVYTHSKVGMASHYPKDPQYTKISFSDTFTTKEADEKISEIGLCNCTPCLADVEIEINNQKQTLLSNIFLNEPGYHLYSVTVAPLPQNTSYTIHVTYKSTSPLTCVFVPMEYKFTSANLQNKYENIDTASMTGKIEGKTIKDINNTLNTNYGNIALYVYTTCENDTTKAILFTYKNMTLPSLIENGRIDNLCTTYKTQTGVDVPIEWHLEPFHYETYCYGTYNAPVAMYHTKSTCGVVNLTQSTVKTYLTALIGTGAYQMRKQFVADMPAKSNSYSFHVSEIKKENYVNLSGNFPISDVTVKVSCNNNTAYTTTDSNGNWKIENFQTYLLGNKGWKDEYANSEIKVSLYDDGNTELLSGTSSITLQRPFDDLSTAEKIILSICIAGEIGLDAALIYALYKAKEQRLSTVTLRFYNGNQYMLLQDVNTVNLELICDDGICDFVQGGNIQSLQGARNINVTRKLKIDAAQSICNEETTGIVAYQLLSGGYIENCNFTLESDVSGNSGGIFYKGDSVTIKNTTVNIISKNGNEVAALGHTLTGNSIVNNVTITGELSGNSVAGAFVETNANIENASIHLNANGTKEAAGLCLKGNPTIKHCMVTGRLDAGENGNAYGIAPGTKDHPDSISQCISALAIIRGNTVGRVAVEKCNNCIAYTGMKVHASTIADAGEILKNETELLLLETFQNIGFDFESMWKFVNKKNFPILANHTNALYPYPFLNPYPTVTGKYIFKKGEAVALYGASSPKTEKITWKNLSPLETVKVLGNNDYMANNDEFYLQMNLAFQACEQYTVDIVSIVYGEEFIRKITIEVGES